ncbi:hypothetical protein A3D14_00210 [Candidatus Saccharibacteria bacterium RIFCSPHIGHO2_02_FULL_47_12]|nr:MAG: hypothetical protein A3D14_00210 [Candidatus Saccharibacteria bacterium RIFCSPHIGHO2_02_FULL_47_12]
MHEFDWFVRHHIKPLGYLRYGDDFVLFMRTQKEANEAQDVATAWLLEMLRLRVHPRNNVVIRANQGLHFLGHSIYSFLSLSVDKVMGRKVKQGLNMRNAASYKAMNLPRRVSKQLPWELLDKLN